MYYNTTNEKGEKLAEYKEKAMTQDEIILDWFSYTSKRQQGLTPSNVQRYALSNAPLTSVRRSMNTLTKQGKLMKTDVKREGIYGRLEHVWKLADPKQGELI